MIVEPEYRTLGARLEPAPPTLEVAAQKDALASLIGRVENILMKGLITDEHHAARLRVAVNDTCRAFKMAPLSEGLKAVLERSK